MNTNTTINTDIKNRFLQDSDIEFIDSISTRMLGLVGRRDSRMDPIGREYDMRMSVDDYQAWTNTTALFGTMLDRVLDNEDVRNRAMLLLYLGNTINEEAGEIAGKTKRVIRDEKGIITDAKALDIAEELGDLLYYMAQLSQMLGYTMQDIMEINVNKLLDRKARGAIQGSGDKR